ncbi:hypothetical protein RUND412_003857 [Rhizina undulata]
MPVCPRALSENEKEGACHYSQLLGRELLSPIVKEQVKARAATRVVVVGGGLTSAQIVDALVIKGVEEVHLIMRGPMKVKHFDVDLEWIGKYKNLQKAIFWSADDDAHMMVNISSPIYDVRRLTPTKERLEMINKARNGGSITPRGLYHKILQKHVATKHVQIHTYTTLSSQSFNPATKYWNLTLSTESPSAALKNTTLQKVSYIYYATGVKPSVQSLPMLQELHKTHPIECKSGLPCLTDDLQWREDVSLFVVRRLASLRLGPGAGNLEGARGGAERVGWRMDELRQEADWPRWWGMEEREEVGEREWIRAGGRNWYDALRDDGSS